MRISEAPMMLALLCKNRGSGWSDIFEITKLAMSRDGKAIYVRVVITVPGQRSICQHYWRDASTLDRDFELFDTM